MVNDFLRKYQEELISERIQLKEDMDLLESKIKEETKFLSILEESNESYFKEFTPRELNAKNNEKADEIREILDNLNKQYDKKNQKMKFYDGRLTELSNIIMNKTNTISPNIAPNSTNTNISIDNTVLKNKLSSVKDLVVFDPYRAKIELENIISSL